MKIVDLGIANYRSFDEIAEFINVEDLDVFDLKVRVDYVKKSIEKWNCIESEENE